MSNSSKLETARYVEPDWTARTRWFRVRTAIGALIYGAPKFKQQNFGWNADPNAPDLQVEPGKDNSVTLTFVEWVEDNEKPSRLTFTECRRWRITPLNDHGWYLGQCRFGQASEKWGEFFEVFGDFRDWGPASFGPSASLDPWNRHSGNGRRNFQFQTRDEAFEVSANGWTYSPAGGDVIASG